jgi:hypothetical protein
MCVCIQLLALEHCWSISTGRCLTTLLAALISLQMTAYLKNWLRSQHMNSNEELMEGVKTWLSSQVADIFDTGIQNLFPVMTSASDYIEN